MTACPECGWVPQVTPRHAARSIRRHRDNGCVTRRAGDAGGDHGGAAATRAEADTRWRERADAAGHTQPTDAEMVARWNERPELYDDLIRVLCGTSLGTIANERRWERERRSA